MSKKDHLGQNLEMYFIHLNQNRLKAISLNKYIKKSNNEILELIFKKQFKIHDLIYKIETTLALERFTNCFKI